MIATRPGAPRAVAGSAVPAALGRGRARPVEGMPSVRIADVGPRGPATRAGPETPGDGERAARKALATRSRGAARGRAPRSVPARSDVAAREGPVFASSGHGERAARKALATRSRGAAWGRAPRSVPARSDVAARERPVFRVEWTLRTPVFAPSGYRQRPAFTRTPAWRRAEAAGVLRAGERRCCAERLAGRPRRRAVIASRRWSFVRSRSSIRCSRS